MKAPGNPNRGNPLKAGVRNTYLLERTNMATLEALRKRQGHRSHSETLRWLLTWVAGLLSDGK